MRGEIQKKVMHNYVTFGKCSLYVVREQISLLIEKERGKGGGVDPTSAARPC